MRIHAVPQWQGALSPRAHDLPGGCDALASAAATWLDADVLRVGQGTAGSGTTSGVASREVLLTNTSAHRDALSDSVGPVLTVGGDCGVELVPVAAARAAYGEELRVVWFDAHPDLNTPQTSPSGAFHGMVLRALLGDGDDELTADPPLSPGSAVLVGTRAFDEAEREAIDRGLAVLSTDPASRVPERAPVYVHVDVDVDVLDPEAFAGPNYPEPGGVTIDELVGLLGSFRGHHVVGAGITECVGSVDEVEVLEPVVRALAALVG